MEHAIQELDARGLNCPIPVLKTKKALKEMTSGDLLKVISSDAGSANDMESLCRQTGHTLLSSQSDAGTFTFTIRKG